LSVPYALFPNGKILHNIATMLGYAPAMVDGSSGSSRLPPGTSVRLTLSAGRLEVLLG
jgi:hypothetical protein